MLTFCWNESRDLRRTVEVPAKATESAGCNQKLRSAVNERMGAEPENAVSSPSCLRVIGRPLATTQALGFEAAPVGLSRQSTKEMPSTV
jgi:hypothetical protein